MELHTEALSTSQLSLINKTLQPHFAKKLRTAHNLEWHKAMEFSLEDPATSHEKFFTTLPQKKHVLMVFELSATYGSVKMAVNFADPFVSQNYAAKP